MLKYNPEDRVRNLLRDEALSLPNRQLPLPEDAIPYLRERAFLGQYQPYDRRTSSGKLSSTQVQVIRDLNIPCYVEAHYHRGLVNAATKSGEPLNVVALHNYMHTQLMLIVANPRAELSVDTQALLKGLELCVRAQIALLNQRNGLSELLQREQQLQLAQLGTLILPSTLITTLREPVHFVDTTALAIGRLAEVMLRQGESECQVSSQTNSSTSETWTSQINPTTL